MNALEYVDMCWRVDDIKLSGPKEMEIVGTIKSQYDKLALQFADGSSLALNANNAKTLVRAYGAETLDWGGKLVKLSLGSTFFQGQPKESILVEPVSPATPLALRTPVAPLRIEPPQQPEEPDPPNDEIPF